MKEDVLWYRPEGAWSQNPPFPVYVWDSYVLINMLGMFHRLSPEVRDKCNNGDWFSEFQWRAADVLIQFGIGAYINNFGDKFTVVETITTANGEVRAKVERKVVAEWKD